MCNRNPFLVLRTLFIFFFSVTLFSVSTAQPQWNWKNPLPEGNPITDVTKLDSNQLIAVGMLGNILKSVDKGENWQSCETGITGNLTKVFFIDESKGWIVGESGLILHTTNGGQNWIQQSGGTSNNLTDLVFPASDTGFVVGSNNTVLMTVDGGATWNSLTTAIPGNYFSVSFPDVKNGWIATGDNDLLHTTDGGENWSPIHPVDQASSDLDLRNVYFVSKDTGWVTGNDTPIAILKTTDGGITWQSQCMINPICSCFRTTDISFLDGNRGVISGVVWDDADGIVLSTENGGISWTQEEIGTPVSGIQLLNNGIAVAVGAGHSMYDENYYSQYELEYSFIKKSADNFSSWENKLAGLTDRSNNSFVNISFPAINTGYVASSYALFKSVDHGNNWTNVHVKDGFGITDFCFMDELHGVVVGGGTSDSAIAHTTDGGVTWHFSYTGPGNYMTYLYSVAFADAMHGWILGYNYPEFPEIFILKTEDGGINWEHQTTDMISTDLTNLCFTDLNNAWCVDGHQKIMHSNDGGYTWNEQYNLSLSGRFSDLLFLDSIHGWASSSQGLYQTNDGGLTWDPVSVNGGMNFLSVFFSDSLNGWTSNSSGKIFRTSDGGTSWQEQEQITHFPVKSIFSSGGDECWAAGQSGMILHLDDGLVSLKELKPALNEIRLSVNPNPFSSVSTISYSIPNPGKVCFYLNDLNGKQIREIQAGNQSNGEHVYRLQCPEITSGTYILTLQLNSENKTQESSTTESIKLIVKK